MKLSGHFLLASLLAVATAPFGAAQETTQRLLRMVPDEFGFVVAAHDLRTQFARWEKSDWLKKIRESALGKGLTSSPEWAELTRVKSDLQSYLGIDWPTLRDDILGESIVLGYRADSREKAEEGLLLVQAGKANVLSNLLDRINALQKKSGELKELEAREHEGIKYFRRVHNKSTQYYFVQDGLLALCGQEATLRTLIQRTRAGEAKAANAWSRSFERGSVTGSFLTFLVNPRAFDVEFAKGDRTDPFQARLVEIWSALDAITLNVQWEETLDVRLALLGNGKARAGAARRLFAPSTPNPLWGFFPKDSILTFTGQADFTLSEGSWGDLLPPAFRKQVLEGLQRSLGALVGLDLEKELLPNVGPDWGICLFGSENPRHVPQAVLALAARPGMKEPGADQALLKGLQFLAGLAIFDYNRTHPDQIRMQTIHQGSIEIKTLINEKGFPAGFQPSFALKEGYLLVATSPEGILHFKKGTPSATVKGENLLMRLSATELGKQMTLRRDFLVEHIAKSNSMGAPAAQTLVDGLQSLFALFDRVEVSHTGGPDHLTLILRVRP